MNSKPMTYGVFGFISGIVLVILIGFIGMHGTMWFGGRYNNCGYPQPPQNQGSIQ